MTKERISRIVVYLGWMLIAAFASAQFTIPIIMQVSVTHSRTCFLTNELGFNAYCFGKDTTGTDKLNVGSTVDEITNLSPIPGILGAKFIIVSHALDTWEMSYKFREQGACAIDYEDKTWCWWNTASPKLVLLVDGTPLRSKKIAMGVYHGSTRSPFKSTCAIDTENALKCWGFVHELSGQPPSEYNYVPDYFNPALYPVGLTKDGSGDSFFARDVAIASVSWRCCREFEGMLCAIDYEDGTFWCSGTVFIGSHKLRQIDLLNGASATAVQCGDLYCCVIDTDLSIQCLGENKGNPATSGSTMAYTTPKASNVKKLSCGMDVCCYVDSSKDLYCFGVRQTTIRITGGSVINVINYVPLPTSVNTQNVVKTKFVNVEAISIGETHSVILDRFGSMRSGGQGGSWLGYGTTAPLINAYGPPVGFGFNKTFELQTIRANISFVAVGLETTCLVVDDHNYATCIGLEGSPLGYDVALSGKKPFLRLPAPVTSINIGHKKACAVANNDAYCWESDSVYQTKQGVKTIKVGVTHSCLIDLNDRLYCTGSNQYKQVLGNVGPTDVNAWTLVSNVSHTVRAVSLGKKFTCAVGLELGNLKCFGQYMSNPFNVPLSVDAFAMTNAALYANITTVECAMETACVLFVNGTIACFGDNRLGELGYSRNRDSAQYYSCFPDCVYLWYTFGFPGTGDYSDVALYFRVLPSVQFRTISSNANANSFCAISMQNDLWCWGQNHLGQLGVGDYSNKYVPVRVNQFNGNALQVTVAHHTCVVTRAEKHLFCFGDNTGNLLGYEEKIQTNATYNTPLSFPVPTGWFASDSTIPHNGYSNGRKIIDRVVFAEESENNKVIVRGLNKTFHFKVKFSSQLLDRPPTNAPSFLPTNNPSFSSPTNSPSGNPSTTSSSSPSRNPTVTFEMDPYLPFVYLASDENYPSFNAISKTEISLLRQISKDDEVEVLVLPWNSGELVRISESNEVDIYLTVDGSHWIDGGEVSMVDVVKTYTIKGWVVNDLIGANASSLLPASFYFDFNLSVNRFVTFLTSPASFSFPSLDANTIYNSSSDTVLLSSRTINIYAPSFLNELKYSITLGCAAYPTPPSWLRLENENEAIGSIGVGQGVPNQVSLVLNMTGLSFAQIGYPHEEAKQLNSCITVFGYLEGLTPSINQTIVIPVSARALQLCPSRTFSVSGKNNQACQTCALGTYSTTTGSTACEVCAAGSYSNDSLTCNECEKGFYSPGQRSDKCYKCGIGKYNENKGQSSCKTCPESRPTTSGETSVALEDCLSPPGFFMDGSGKSPLACVPGMVCSNVSGVTLSNLELDVGYWRTGTNSSSILKCPKPQYCKGGKIEEKSNSTRRVLLPSTNSSSSLCIPFHKGIFCYDCADGYVKRGLHHLCSACSDADLQNDQIRVSGIMIGLIVLFFTILFTVWFYTRRNLLLSQRSLRTGDMEVQLEKNSFDRKFNPAIDLIVKFKILIGLFQVLGSMSYEFVDVLPPEFSTLRNLYALFCLNLVEIFDFGCSLSFQTHYSSLLLATLLPAGVIAIIFLLRMGGVEYYRRKQMEELREEIDVVVSTSVLLVLFIVYPSVSSTILKTFNCQRFDNDVYALRADYSLECYVPTHTSYVAYAAFMVLVYPVGVPFIFAWLLYKHRGEFRTLSVEELNKKTSLRHIRFLWREYKTQFYFYEVLNLFSKLIQTSLIVFASPGNFQQMVFQVFFSLLFAGCFLYLVPYKEKTNNFLAIASQFVIFAISFISLLLKLDQDFSKQVTEYESAFNLGVLNGLLLFLLILVPVLTVCEIINELRKDGFYKKVLFCFPWRERKKKLNPSLFQEIGSSGNSLNPVLTNTGGGGEAKQVI